MAKADVSGVQEHTGALYFTERLGLGGQTLTVGTTTPEGGYAAPVGSLFLRADGGAGTTFYVKESGSGKTGWVAK